MMTDDDFLHTILKFNNYHNFNDLWSGHLFQQNDISDFLPDFPHLFEASLMLQKRNRVLIKFMEGNIPVWN